MLVFWFAVCSAEGEDTRGDVKDHPSGGRDFGCQRRVLDWAPQLFGRASVLVVDFMVPLYRVVWRRAKNENEALRATHPSHSSE